MIPTLIAITLSGLIFTALGIGLILDSKNGGPDDTFWACGGVFLIITIHVVLFVSVLGGWGY